MIDQTNLSYDITSNCTCESLDENDNPIPAEICWGDCYDIALDNLDEIIKPWLSRNDLDLSSELQVKGRNMGWTRASGTAFTTAEDLIDTLTFDGDWRLVFTLDSNYNLSVVRYSHDEPTGASFTIEPKGFYECVDCGTILGETRTPVCQPCYEGAN